MDIKKVWSDAAVNVALRPGATDEERRALSKVARIHPDSIINKITELRRQIDFLRDHLSEVPTHD